MKIADMPVTRVAPRGSRHKPVPHRHAIITAARALQELGFSLDIHADFDGWLSADSDRAVMRLPLRVTPFRRLDAVVENRHDRSKALTLALEELTLVCGNGLMIPSAGEIISRRRHSGEPLGEFHERIIQARESFERALEGFDSLPGRLCSASVREPGETLIDLAKREILPPSRILAAYEEFHTPSLEYEHDGRGNLYGLAQAVTLQYNRLQPPSRLGRSRALSEWLAPQIPFQV